MRFQLALEEIRRLFDRYREVGRHGMVTERDEIEEVEEIEERTSPRLGPRPEPRLAPRRGRP
jgi:hypothetical protein